MASDILRITEQLQKNSEAIVFRLNSSRVFNEIMEQIAVKYFVSKLNYKK